ncbi:PEGA domain-containing protein [uncultured Flavobacterium sp.]|uniref:PEGA domain-containing protein n=1 Tax=uncultured Flavobacterium sp. TaxID=165435 RepID=UPI0030C7BDFB
MKKTVQLLLFALFIQSCGTLYAPKYNNVYVTSNPSGAQVEVEGDNKGITPIEISLLAKKSHNIHISKEGYKDSIINLESRVDSKFILMNNINVFYQLIDIISGDWKQIKEKEVSIPLEKNEQNF